ncbi:putative bifunctional diguanylate cyclase/phosphodiesterase [Pelomicrobium sp.]|jgi:diguanylate cyclase (GGDEF)-like protein/PAS domain S-box-containing protein/excisionase family DNA binding protein|uniref:putative bifunctional diguanylate cyclase/phosphodiesterase n=1 Tax=Pelomicrobium sp. TaxID=2815319 RepID=UPI002FDD7910
MGEKDLGYSAREAAARLGIPVWTLRRWDIQGVLVATRTRGGHRRYPRELIDRLAALGTGQDRQQADELAIIRRELKEKRRIVQLLVDSEQRYRDLVETSHDLIWATDALGRFTYLNNAAQDIFGLPPKALLGRCFFDFEARPSHISNRRFLALLKRQGEVRNYLTHIVSARGHDRWVGINARVSYDENHQIVGIRGTARDITEQQLAAQRIERLAKFDTLTDLPNRLSLQEELTAVMDGGGVGALLFIDIDHFKYVNDNLGHRAGDQLIVGVAGVLKQLLQELPGQVYRLGGDEFAILVPEALRLEAQHVAERVLEAVRHYKFAPESGTRKLSHLTASIGIALYPFHGADLSSLLAAADIALYHAKDQGRNRSVLFDQDSNSLRSTHKRVHWARRFREVLEEDRVVLYAQPVVALASAEPVHYEVLARIREQDGSVVPASEFIELAETLGVVRDIDLAVIRKLIRFLASGTVPRNARYFVNLSRASISDEHWMRRLLAALGESGIDPERLVFEITETAAMSELDVTLTFMQRMKERGCHFALDDFGAGFSSFYYLKRFPVDYLKIDGGFVRDLLHDEGSRIFIRAVCDVARGMNRQVVAEWVEHAEVVRLLLDMGVQYGQGFLFSRPAPLISLPETPTGALKSR